MRKIKEEVAEISITAAVPNPAAEEIPFEETVYTEKFRVPADTEGNYSTTAVSDGVKATVERALKSIRTTAGTLNGFTFSVSVRVLQ